MTDLYKQSGVDTELGDSLVDWLGATPSRQQNALGHTVAGVGGFAALWRPQFPADMQDPLLVTSTDGVGTKVLLGLESDRLEGLGIDLVAMCVNDLYTLGATPMFFLDYYATGQLEAGQFKRILSGIRNGLEQCQTALLGGETAELPGLYAKGHFDLAGFVVGAVDGTKTLGSHRVKAGDHLLALPSSGFHSNGYSLIRRWLAAKKPSPELLDRLMAPTRIYHFIPELVRLLGPERLHALAHITGGGISGNLPRVLPDGLQAELAFSSLPTPDWMLAFIKANAADIQAVEAVFNLGVGMIAVVAPEAVAAVLSTTTALGCPAQEIGMVRAGDGPAQVRYLS